jgi:hypothetical protein
VKGGGVLLINGQLVTLGDASDSKSSRKKLRKSDGEFRRRLIKKFSAKTQVGSRLEGKEP